MLFLRYTINENKHFFQSYHCHYSFAQFSPNILYFSCNFYLLLLNIGLIFSVRFRFGEGEHLIDVFFVVSYEKKSQRTFSYTSIICTDFHCFSLNFQISNQKQKIKIQISDITFSCMLCGRAVVHNIHYLYIKILFFHFNSKKRANSLNVDYRLCEQ